MTIARDRDGTTIKIVDTANPADADPANPQFTQAMDLGGGRTMHTRAMEADDDGNVVEEVVVVMTDIAAPKATAFEKVRDADGVLTQVLNARNDGENVVPDTNPADSLTVAAGVDNVNLPKIKSAAFTAGTVATLTFAMAVEAAENVTAVKAFETAGTYNGADGTYRCNGTADCMVTLDAKGAITAISEGWVFTPAKGATSYVRDYDYLNYGFWLKKTTDADGATTYNEVETFAGATVGENTDGSGNVADVTGKATYSGDAAGVYVHSVKNPDGTEASATSGHFKAKAELNATFGQVNNAADDGTIAPAELDTLSGTIDNFELSGHDEGPGWSVSLEQTDIADGDPGAGVPHASGVTKGGGADGSYSATFHGSVEPVVNVVPQPSSVVGEFNANFSNGSVAGGFGATK